MGRLSGDMGRLSGLEKDGHVLVGGSTNHTERHKRLILHIFAILQINMTWTSWLKAEGRTRGACWMGLSGGFVIFHTGHSKVTASSKTCLGAPLNFSTQSFMKLLDRFFFGSFLPAASSPASSMASSKASSRLALVLPLP